jgi:hypothetical protein
MTIRNKSFPFDFPLVSVYLGIEYSSLVKADIDTVWKIKILKEQVWKLCVFLYGFNLFSLVT